MKTQVHRDENKLKAKLIESIRLSLRSYVILSHQDIRTNGIPDFSLTGRGKTTWWEVKHGTPNFDSQGYQELTMLRLEVHGCVARYILFIENPDGSNKRTLLVRPSKFKNYAEDFDLMVLGFDFESVVSYMRTAHEH